MMPLGAPSISKYGSLVRLDAQIVGLRAHCAQGSPIVWCGISLVFFFCNRLALSSDKALGFTTRSLH